MNKREVIVAGTVSAALLTAAARHWIGLGMTEVLGFITGGLCVWLTVKENVWNWPIGIANCVFFILLFWQARLFADMGLQFVYIILSFLGWYWWLRGGQNKTALPISRTPAATWAWLAPVIAVSTFAMTLYLRSINDAAPFWDAFTTVVSLAAQYLLTRKYLENWYLWITVDVVYVFLYAYKDLYLTGVLYVIFLCMCLAGLKDWQINFKQTAAKTAAITAKEAYAEAI